jgi:hypothetical protein
VNVLNALVPHIRNGFESETNLKKRASQTSEHIGLNCMPWSTTYKAGTTGDIPPTEVLIKGRGPIKHRCLTQEEEYGNMIG